MATLNARKDDEYAYFAAADSFGIPTDAFDLLRHRCSAEWSKQLRELRVRRNVAANAIDQLEVLGHRVRLIRDDEPVTTRTAGPLECAGCGYPYRWSNDPDAWMRRRPCVECGKELVLVPPPEVPTRGERQRFDVSGLLRSVGAE